MNVLQQAAFRVSRPTRGRQLALYILMVCCFSFRYSSRVSHIPDGCKKFGQWHVSPFQLLTKLLVRNRRVLHKSVATSNPSKSLSRILKRQSIERIDGVCRCAPNLWCACSICVCGSHPSRLQKGTASFWLNNVCSSYSVMTR